MPLDASPPAVPPAEAPALLRAGFPALAHLLGPERFAALAAAAGARAAASDTPVGGLLHGLLLRRDAPLPELVPARLAADVAALEWTILQVARLAPRYVRVPRARPADLAALDEPSGGWRDAVFEPIRAFDIVPVAWRIEAWVRRLHADRPAGLAPGRHEQHIVVAVAEVPGLPARPDAPDDGDIPGDVAAAHTWWFGLAPAHGRLLGSLALGAPAGLATDTALAHGDLRDAAEARELIDLWLREGLFARVLRDGAGG